MIAEPNQPDGIDRGTSCSGNQDDDDGGDYELEPLDPDVIASEERRTREILESADAHVDVDALYREAEKRHLDDFGDLFRKLPSRFQVKHMLVATALLAIVLALGKIIGPIATVFLVGVSGVVGSLAWIQWQERQHERKLAARRHQFIARQRAQRARDRGDELEAARYDKQAADANAAIVNEVDTAWQEAMARQSKLAISFSIRQLLGAITCAAVVLGLLAPLGASYGAFALGMIAGWGLVLHWAGYEPPPIIALGWWLLLVLYITVSLIAVFVPG
jgi:Flp pilus assembly protein TadB